MFFAFSIENNLYFCTQKETLCQLILTLSKTTTRKATIIQEGKEEVIKTKKGTNSVKTKTTKTTKKKYKKNI